MPADSERMARRALRVVGHADEGAEANGHGNGCCGGNGHAPKGVLSLDVLANGCGS